MSQINTNVDSLIAINNLTRTNKQLGVALTRLSTGVRVNSGKDDPAGLISGQFLGLEQASIRSAIANNNRANNMLATADNSLSEINNLLQSIAGVVSTSANKGVLSQEEINANQALVDSSVNSINRIAQTTSFNGRKLLDGSLGFQLTGLDAFSSGTATFTDVRVNVANFNGTGSAITINVTLTTAATVATVNVAAATAGSDSTIEVIGNRGAVTINIGNGQDVAAAVNGFSDVTGVTATGTTLQSIDFGSNAFVRVRNITGTVLSESEVSGTGANAVGTINGQNFSSDGLKASLKTGTLDVEVTFSAGTADGTNTSFQIVSGGAQFQLGAQINIASQLNLGLQSFSAASLGSVSVAGDRTLASIVTGGANSLINGKFSIAADIIKQATSQVASARARLGAIQANTISANVNSLQVSLENISAAKSAIVDTDFAEETANLTRLQILVQANTSSLAIANSRPQGVLSLLGR